MKRVVLDSNVFISSFFWEGRERDLLRLCKEGKVKLVVSSFILEEVEKVLIRKFRVEEHLSRSFIREIFTFSELVITTGALDVIKEDPSDDHILETAVLGNVSFLITGDNHLLKLGDYKGVVICKTSEFSHDG
ncbi:MAG: putative toxin-antitoxin system toxin component, PIN family [Thermoplasmata archaeon]|nr:putative toxin-antitoxin system toxin component, PIN family [Thermoplasmata archaeon]